ncbi:MAG: family 20 glycosylhydrolase [bacterium]|nr:family 20 glycosylhydrolase [bacterium]
MIARRAGRVLGAAALACAALMAAVPPPDASQSPPPASGAAISVLPLPRRLTLLGAGWCGERFRTYEVRFEGVPSEPGALELLEQRWGAIGVTPRPGASVRIDVSKLRPDEAALSRDLGDEGYVVVIDRHGVRISAATAAGRFYGMMTLAQLPQRKRGRGWCLPDARVVDWPAMRWRGLSDDLSRGPIPTLAFLKERIRAIAAFKGNLYSLYLESAFRDPQEPLASPQDAITPRELADLAAYAARYHVALMPEQETLGHMHRLLSYERYAGLAELPHDYVLAPAVPGAEQLMQGIVDDEGAAVRGRTPFFHLGGDEPNLVGSGRSADLAKRVGPEAMYLGYYTPLFAAVAAMGMRPVVWGDFLLAHAGAIAKLPKSVVVANWHYAAEASYIKYLEPFAKALQRLARLDGKQQQFAFQVFVRDCHVFCFRNLIQNH